jgi:mannose-6-phosphate isomerase-like protein (cupin superfamily)
MENYIRSRSAAEHYTRGQGCDAWFLLKVPTLTVIQERMPSLADEVMHKHAICRQLFFILKGEATMLFEDSEVQIPAGEAIEIVPGVAYKMKNSSTTQDLEFLVISHPPSHGAGDNSMPISCMKPLWQA